MTTFSEAIRLEQGRLHNLAYHQARVDRTAGHFSGRVRASPVCRIQSPKRYGRGCSSAGSYMAATSGRSSTFLMYGDGSKSRSNPGRCHRLLLQIYGSEPIEYTAARFGVRRDRHCPPRSGDGCLGFQSRVRVCRRTFTPAGPLLAGTKRQELLERGLIAARRIEAQELGDYLNVRFINAMTDLKEAPKVATAALVRL